MKALGIELKTPDLASLVVTGVMGLFIVMGATAVIAVGLATVNNGVAIATGMIGGSLANAYGVSVKDSGWRGALLSTAFSLGLMALVRALMWATMQS